MTTGGRDCGQRKQARLAGGGLGGTVTIACKDGSAFLFPRQDCLLLPIMHTMAKELAVYLYGRILSRLDANYLLERGANVMEVTVSEAIGQEAAFRRAIPRLPWRPHNNAAAGGGGGRGGPVWCGIVREQGEDTDNALQDEHQGSEDKERGGRGRRSCNPWQGVAWGAHNFTTQWTLP